MTPTDIAIICHEVNHGYCQALGDFSQVHWAAAPQWQKDSALNGVLLHLKNPEATPKESHQNWLAEKQAAGWTWGPVKDPELKQHPCFKPYEELPQEQRAKDYIFKSVVIALRPYMDAEF